MVASRSTSGVDDFTHTLTAPLPTTVVLVVNGADTNETALPAGFCCQFQLHCDALPHSPPVPVLGPKSVSGSAAAFAVNAFDPVAIGAWSVSAPAAPRYHVRAIVPGTGSAGNVFSNPA